jgi:cytochrome b subunit of formate dehydrogenase
MTTERVTRFSSVEIAYHWAQALPYGVLFLTGAAMLTARLLGVEVPGYETLRLVHKVAGMVLLASLAFTVVAVTIRGRLGLLWRTLCDASSWRLRDIVWLIKAPLHAVWPSVRLPQADRLNPGQKLHLLALVFIVAGFIVSGVLMSAIRGALAPWAIHMLLFVPACALLATHMFMSLINPPTRRALSGMFLGHVPADYAKAHHPLWAGAKNEPHRHHAMISRPALVSALVVLAMTVAGLAWQYGAERISTRLRDVWQEGGRPVMSPGGLSAAHARAPGNSDCMACHEPWAPVSTDKCLACHPAIGQARAAERGYHGSLAGDCRRCHGEHKGADADIRKLDPATFNHDLAAYHLEGRHREINCEACHLKKDGAAPQMRYAGLRFAACTDCHANPHDTPSATDCAKCHTVKGWKQPLVNFDHNRDTRFVLDGSHTLLTCDSCHRTPAKPTAPAKFVFRGIGLACTDCHPDPHEGALGGNCRQCHKTAAWVGRSLNFDHSRDTGYLLEGKHEGVECLKCHLPPKKQPTPPVALAGAETRCDACHKDPHGGQFQKDCQACHTEAGWTGPQMTFVHNRDSKYVLAGKHEAVACTKCHVTPDKQPLAAARFTATATRCDACHKDPHGGQFQKDCQACHTAAGWKGPQVTFVHNRDSGYALDAVHKDIACASCHHGQPVVYRPMAGDCASCHAHAAMAVEGRLVSGPPQPDPHAGRVDCAKCHDTSKGHAVLGDYAKTCSQCHDKRYEDLLGDWAQSLKDREVRAESLLAELRRKGAPEADAVAAKIKEAKAVGLHNVQLARKMWDEILAPVPAGDHPPPAAK